MKWRTRTPKTTYTSYYDLAKFTTMSKYYGIHVLRELLHEHHTRHPGMSAVIPKAANHYGRTEDHLPPGDVRVLGVDPLEVVSGHLSAHGVASEN